MLLKQSTAVVIPFGPFLDKTDGVTHETGLVSAIDHASTGIMLSKNGGAKAVRHASVTASSYDAYGDYRVTLDTTDTGTLGSLRVSFADPATCLPVWADFQVVPANVYDSLVLGSDLLDASVAQIAGAAVDVTAAQLGVNVVNWKGAAAAAMTGDAFARLGAPAGASVSVDLAAVKTETASIQSDTNDLQTRLPAALVSGRMDSSVGAMAADTLTASALATDAVTEIQSGLSTLNAAGVRSAVGLASANLDTQIAAIPTAAAVSDAVWDEAISGHLTSGTTGASLNGAGSAGDPWTTALPGAYSAGSAGKILGDNLNATVSSRSSHSAADVWAVGTRTLSSFGSLVADIVTAVWAAVARTLTDKTGFALTSAYDPAKTAAQSGDAMALTTAERASVADKLLGRNLAGGSDGGRTVTSALRTLRNKVTISGGTITVYAEDDTTIAYTGTVTTDAAAEPITGVDPS